MSDLDELDQLCGRVQEGMHAADDGAYAFAAGYLLSAVVSTGKDRAETGESPREYVVRTLSELASELEGRAHG